MKPHAEGRAVSMHVNDAKLPVSLGSEEWVYVWLRPTGGK